MKVAYDSLKEQRCKIEAEYEQYNVAESGSFKHVSHAILQSWQRCKKMKLTTLLPVSKAEVDSAKELSKNHFLVGGVLQIEDELIELINDAGASFAISNHAGRILWSYAAPSLQAPLIDVGFRQGGDWSEKRAGTNAINMALRSLQPESVFSAEHYLPAMHNWASYAIPVSCPVSGEVLGFLAMILPWERHTSLALLAIMQIADIKIKKVLTHPKVKGLKLYMLGQAKVELDGMSVKLRLRQYEILCLLALNPDGLDFVQMYDKLYGDKSVAKSTLRGEISNLRDILNGAIASRPYRITLPIYADFIDVLASVTKGNTRQAVSLYRGSLLPNSGSPEIEEWRLCLEVAVSMAVDSCGVGPKDLGGALLKGKSVAHLLREKIVDNSID